jgi:hypothetical protein
MTPRLTTRGRIRRVRVNYHCYKSAELYSSPSPAERLRQRRKARAAAMRSLKQRDEVDLTLAYMVGRGDRSWPESRGTTTGQLVAMHLEAEAES